MTRIIAAVLFSTIATAAVAQAVPVGVPAAPAVSEAETARLNEVVCKRVEQLGTRLGGKRECKSRADWEREERALRQDMQQSLNRRVGGDTR